MGKYTVKSGDTLSEIAAANGTTVDELVRINGISDPDRIFAGQEIKLSDDTGGTGSSGGGGSGYEYKTSPFTTSEETNNAYNALNGLTKPEDIDPSYEAAWKDALDRINNREKFSYDLNGDALYQQYKDKYIQQGKMAMQDTMGQAAALTGGYGNSYAATAGNQAYQAHLNNLNDIIPELQQMAYDRYNQEGQDLYNQYTMAMNNYSAKYGEHSDAMNQYNADRQYLYGVYDSLYNRDYNAHRDAITDEQWQAAMDYQTGRDKIADEQWQKIYDAQYGNTGGTVTIPDSIRGAAANFTNNKSLETWLMAQEAAGIINHEQALQLMAEFMDVNEKYETKEDGSSSPSYKAMVESTNGWEVVDDGGINWLWGIDENARIKSPNGETMTTKQLKAKLKAEGMTDKQAKNAVVALQKKLGI